MSNENLQFLTVEQNLADTAAIVEHVKQTIGGGKRRVVLNFGGSYSGATAAWFREAYPNVTHGAFSSSGVVNAILDMTQFDEAVAEAIAIPRPACRTALIASTRAMEVRSYFLVFVPTIREIRYFYREMQRTNRESITIHRAHLRGAREMR
eukprot:SAG31_NODE_716_length_12626_cov_7.493973_3_plen_151_part_00